MKRWIRLIELTILIGLGVTNSVQAEASKSGILSAVKLELMIKETSAKEEFHATKKGDIAEWDFSLPLFFNLCEPKASADIDTPLVPIADHQAIMNYAYTQNPESGWVADGVTPFINAWVVYKPINFVDEPGSLTTIQLKLSLKGGTISGGVETHFKQLKQSSWVNDRNMTYTNQQVFTYGEFPFYLEAIKPEEIKFDPGVNELTLTMVATTNMTNDVSLPFNLKIRKPPLVLVHGYNSDSNFWSTNFIAILTNNRVPADFVIPVNYGVGVGKEGPDPAENTYGNFTDLNGVLSQVLRDQVEDKFTDLRSKWLFTRYDAIGHSQGGVLLRLLSSQAPTPNLPPAFRSDRNAYRGRFRKVVTIGSPQNGSSLLYYGLNANYGSINTVKRLKKYLFQPKFSPFGEQIRRINEDSIYELDPQASITPLVATIYGGTTPTTDDAPAIYTITRLYETIGSKTRGAILLPNGSDGIVEPTSQQADVSNASVSIPGNISHSADIKEGLWLIQTSNGEDKKSNTLYETDQSETASLAVAQACLVALDKTQRDAFKRPVLLTKERQKEIDAIVPKKVGKIVIGKGAVTIVPKDQIEKNLLEFEIIEEKEKRHDNIDWWPALYGAEGISIPTNVNIIASNSDKKKVTIEIPKNLEGQITLMAESWRDENHYRSSKEILIKTQHPESIAEIAINPSAIQGSKGVEVPLEVWGRTASGKIYQLFIGKDSVKMKRTGRHRGIAKLINNDQTLRLKHPGKLTLRAEYEGLSAETTVEVNSVSRKPATVTFLKDEITLKKKKRKTIVIPVRRNYRGKDTVAYQIQNLTTNGNFTFEETTGEILFRRKKSRKAKIKIKLPDKIKDIGELRFSVELLPNPEKAVAYPTAKTTITTEK